jgi:hypothetical protein
MRYGDEFRVRETSAVGRRYQRTGEGTEDWEDLVRVTVNCRLCRYMKGCSYLQLRDTRVKRIRLPIQTLSWFTHTRDNRGYGREAWINTYITCICHLLGIILLTAFTSVQNLLTFHIRSAVKKPSIHPSRCLCNFERRYGAVVWVEPFGFQEVPGSYFRPDTGYSYFLFWLYSFRISRQSCRILQHHFQFNIH